MSGAVDVRWLREIGEAEIRALSNVLIDCVEGGASVSFMLPMTQQKAEAFWRHAAASQSRGERMIFAAFDERLGLVGTVTLLIDLPENQPHRADLAKMLVHRSARGRGVGAALLQFAEQAAQRAGKTLIVLDTVTGTAAERLYARHGWQRVGEVPNYALWPDGRPCPTTFYYKALGTV